MKKDKPIVPDDVDSRGAMAAMERAAEAARKTAIQTDTAIIIVRDGQRIRVTAEELQKQVRIVK